MLLWILSFRPQPLWWGTVVGFTAMLVFSERMPTWWSLFRWSLIFGALGIGYGYRWLAPTITLFGGVEPLWAWLLTALFGVIGLVHGYVFVAFYRSILARGHRPHPLTTAALWV